MNAAELEHIDEARDLMRTLDIHPKTLARDAEKAGDRSAFEALKNAFFFDKETFGTDRLVVGLPPGGKRGTLPAWRRFLAGTPLSPGVQQDIARLQTAKVDYLQGLSNDEKKERLSRLSYRNFLLDMVKVDPGVIPFYQSRTHALYGVGIDAVGALECWAYGYPGFAGMQLDAKTTGRMSYTARGSATKKPAYEFHFPDGTPQSRGCWCGH
jgi:spermidine dehydrogenase